MAFDQREAGNLSGQFQDYLGEGVGHVQQLATGPANKVHHMLGASAITRTSVGRRTAWSTEAQGNIGINAQTIGSTLNFDAGSTPPQFQRAMG